MFQMPDFQYIAAAIPSLVLALSMHEFGHAAMATKMGDPTPRLQGRLTINPLAHLDPMGTIFMIMTLFFGFGFGWGKPVQTNPMYYRDYKTGRILVAIAGPAMNLSLMMLGLGIAYVLYKSGIAIPIFVHLLLSVFIMINFVLMVFNLLPIPPLDGGHVLEMVVPWRHRERVRQLAQYGMLLLLGLMFLGILRFVISFFFSILAFLISVAFGSDFTHFLGFQ
jgi:Zn-dependent protease